jgi:hypothetical protein
MAHCGSKKTVGGERNMSKRNCRDPATARAQNESGGKGSGEAGSAAILYLAVKASVIGFVAPDVRRLTMRAPRGLPPRPSAATGSAARVAGFPSLPAASSGRRRWRQRCSPRRAGSETTVTLGATTSSGTWGRARGARRPRRPHATKVQRELGSTTARKSPRRAQDRGLQTV